MDTLLLKVQVAKNISLPFLLPFLKDVEQISKYFSKSNLLRYEQILLDHQLYLFDYQLSVLT